VRTFTLVATIIVFLASTAIVSQTYAQDWLPNTTKDPRWTIEFAGKAYDRPGDELGLPLITDGITMESLFNSGQASELGTTVGAEVKFDFLTQRGREIEIRTIIADWDQDHEITGPNLRSPFFTVPGSEPTSVNYQYTSDYFSIEIMGRRAISPGITCSCGPRFVSTKDQVKFAGSLTVDPGDGSPPIDFTQTQTTEATNALIGLQAGLEINVPISRDLYGNGFIRAGGYTNPTELTTTVSNTFAPVVSVTKDLKSTGSFLGEVGGRLYADIVPNSMAIFVGYEATWIDGVAIAPAQLLPSEMTGVETANTPFFQAVTFGFNFTPR